MPRLLLINPTNIHRGLGNIKSTAWPPLNLPYLAAVTPKHYQISVIDENIEPFVFQEADIVGITAYTATVTRAYEISQIYRKKGIPTVMGGIHVSMMPEEALNFCNTVVIGEAEGIWTKVLEDFESGNLKDRYEGARVSLDELPIPRRDILKNNHYRWGSIQTSRGCPMNCSFCSVTAFNGRQFRRRPIEDVIVELEQIPQKRIMLTDDNLIGHGKEDREWTRAFFTRILEKGIKKFFFGQTSILLGKDPGLARIASRAGLKIVLIGIESVNSKTLESYGKHPSIRRLNTDQYKELITNIRKSGIAVLGAFVLGSDEDDHTVFHNTLEFIKSARIDVLQITKPTPLPGTQFWKELQQENRIERKDFPNAWNDFRLTKMVYKPLKLSVEDIYMGFTYLRNIYYSTAETFKRTLSTLITTKNFSTTVTAYAFNASYRKAFLNSDHYQKYNSIDLTGKFKIN
ncbi:MAG: radical SAM protein [Thermodesulfobacteriota bacterium]